MLIEKSTLVIVEQIQVENSLPCMSKGNRRLNKVAKQTAHQCRQQQVRPYRIRFFESFISILIDRLKIVAEKLIMRRVEFKCNF